MAGRTRVGRVPSRLPRVKRLAAAGWVALALAIAAGCGDESDEREQERAAREAWCNAGCAAAARCAGRSGTPECAATCRDSADGYFLRMNPNKLLAEADCLARATSCVDGIEELFGSCEEETRLGFPATEASVTSCEVMAAPLFECGWFVSLDQCASYFAIFSTAALQDWQTCGGIFDCEQLGQCTAATVYDYGDG